MRNFILTISLVFLTPSFSHGQETNPYTSSIPKRQWLPFPDSLFNRYLSADERANDFYTIVRVKSPKHEEQYIVVENQYLYHNLKRFSIYKAYADHLLDIVSHDGVLECNEDEYGKLLEYVAPYRSSDFASMSTSDIIDKYYSQEQFIKAEYYKDRMLTNKLMIHLFLNKYIFRQDDLSGDPRIIFYEPARK